MTEAPDTLLTPPLMYLNIDLRIGLDATDKSRYRWEFGDLHGTAPTAAAAVSDAIKALDNAVSDAAIFAELV